MKKAAIGLSMLGAFTATEIENARAGEELRPVSLGATEVQVLDGVYLDPGLDWAEENPGGIAFNLRVGAVKGWTPELLMKAIEDRLRKVNGYGGPIKFHVMPWSDQKTVEFDAMVGEEYFFGNTKSFVETLDAAAKAAGAPASPDLALNQS